MSNSIDARDISEAISAMEAAKIFIEQTCAVGGGRVEHMVRLESAARSLKFGLQSVKLEIKQAESA